jgi:hypothetical protein
MITPDVIPPVERYGKLRLANPFSITLTNRPVFNFVDRSWPIRVNVQ